jgi:hypothetical protein
MTAGTQRPCYTVDGSAQGGFTVQLGSIYVIGMHCSLMCMLVHVLAFNTVIKKETV